MSDPAPRPGTRVSEWLGRGGLVLASLVLCAAALEIALRLDPELFGIQIANQIFSSYGRKPGGMYFEEPTTGMRLMHPDFESRAYFNGYTWKHATDARGFRNPPGRRVDGTLLLGDSQIYGHGVEEPETVASQLESRYGRPVYNLSRQGDCLYQHYVLLRLQLDTFRPENVVLFVFHNDFQDLLFYRGLERLEHAPEIDRYDYDAIRAGLAERDPEPHSWSRRLRYGSFVYRLFLALRSRAERLPEGGEQEAIVNAVEGLDRPLLEPETRAVLTRYYDRILADLATRSAAVGARLIVVYLDAYNRAGSGVQSAQDQARALLSDVTRRHGIAYFDTGERLQCQGCKLPADGHLSAEGHRRLAGFVDAALREVAAR